MIASVVVTMACVVLAALGLVAACVLRRRAMERSGNVSQFGRENTSQARSSVDDDIYVYYST